MSYHSACDFGMSTLLNLDNFYGAFILAQFQMLKIKSLGIRIIDLGIGALKKGFPILGICFGHQLMCHALGGEVVKNQETNPEQKGSRVITFKNKFGEFLPEMKSRLL